ncbi:MAG: tRNA dihydrouridine synthase DusB [Candidatus Thiodiazotropha weberae]|uniref:tRNA-dihydrouridine synthase B n=1 Tax=Candidatus Thiodiazotropha endoloripes TaxID=1818881 RepID=A0A1E2ULZ1_9GAMM|nr:tRNA dihydrouridine synthase DusB [Candidatus Thiodiazotropha endoloripes]MCG7897446.1 tRNA dihydrouridine synthase DusB [Candidatus Thiodiazotropha weberae]ODB84074.1 tRNA dihydrouridine synthase DusB [Candidatus Thiodiazotropha endoloripes]ODB91561.1 tRNA dihydrouridine synthase DusB [Candidatus Thiodiazotropha endoloripes]ODB93702.1 tRNA dihydrouridine synthase DusB [Candidatus Thiodiazotropha endoloripes]ODB95757.1 tRNA dihydrouridine synthase DusB [Candidatus Thiodiazotropha endoloripe
MRIGSYEIANNLLLAPMAGVTDRPFRQLCRSLGAGLAVSEMISADASLWGTKKSVKRLDHDGEEAPISVQILGSDPQVMAQAAQANVAMGAQIIDINMGCPAKKVCKKSAGSALLKDESLVSAILKATVDAVEVPVTLKIRTGTDPQNRNGERIAEIAEDAGIQALSVHGRTRACKFAGQAEYETIGKIKQKVTIPVIANGDIDSPQKAAEVLEKTGADALMIGRAAQGRPWIFNEISSYLATGQLLPEPELEWVADILTRHVQQLYGFYGEYLGVRIARKHIAWYSKGHPEGAVFRNRINYSESPAEQLQAIKEYFQFLRDNRDLAA